MSNTAVPSKLPEDFLLNVESLDKFSSSSALTFANRLGQTKKTMAAFQAEGQAAVYALAAFNARGAFAGATAYALKDVYSAAGIAYVAVVAHISTTVAADLAAGKVTIHQGATREDMAAPAGSGMSGHSAALNYAAGTIGAIINDLAVNVKMFPWLAKGDGVTDDTAAIKAALAASNYVIFPRPAVAYKMTEKLVTNGHRLEGLGRPCENYGTAISASAIIEFVGVVGDCILNTGTKSEYKNIWFRAKSWATACHGLYLERQVMVEGCLFTHFNGHGAYFSSAGGVAAPYHSVFTDCQFLFNAKHGAAVLNGANALSFIHCQGRWNGSLAYGVQPGVAGLYDGLYINGAEAGFPAGGSAFEPQGLLVVGGDWSYNSRYGQNWSRAFDGVQQGGYIEGNLVSDMRVGAIYGCVIDNPLTQQSPVLALVEQDPTTSTMNLGNYPNQIRIRGTNYGTGIKQAASSRTGYRTPMPAFYTIGSGAELRINPTVAGGVKVEAGAATAWTYDSTVRMSAPSWTLGAADTTSPGVNYMDAPSGTTTQGNLICYLRNGGQYGEFNVANGGGANAAAAYMKAPKNSATGRSINAGGTVNAAGADYAEYLRKAYGCGLLAKGDVVGIDAQGLLTDKFADAVSFCIKSTNPSYVGGDTWGEAVGEAPHPSGSDATAEQQAQYESDKAAFDAALEVLRTAVDRIAFCGQVPVNLQGAQPGQWLIPVESNGRITALAVSAPSFEQFMQAIGKVIAVEPDGRARVIVRVA